jgi:hypothetical protein
MVRKIFQVLRQEPLIFACDYITEEKVHTDCRNAEVLAKTGSKEEPATTDTTTAPPHTTRSKVDKPKEETVKAEPSSAPSYMTSEQDKKNPFIVGTAVWQTSMKYWLDAYGEFLKNAPKMTEDWYDIFWKPWLNWTPQRQERD